MVLHCQVRPIGRYIGRLVYQDLHTTSQFIIIHVFRPNDIYNEEPHPDCVGTYIGSLNSAEDQHLALTSLLSSISPSGEVRTARQEVFTANPILYRMYLLDKIVCNKRSASNLVTG